MEEKPSFSFLNPFFSKHTLPPRTLAEQRVIQASASIREKENWFVKYKDPEIRARWRRELNGRLKADELDYVFAELEYYDRLREHTKRFQLEISTADGVWQSDTLLVPFRDRLCQQFEQLEQYQLTEREEGPDWHPASNGQVLDLIHPSLFCHQIQISEESRKPKRKPHDLRSTHSTYQWIPTDMKWNSETNTFQFQGRINNLNEDRFPTLKPLLEEVINKVTCPLLTPVLRDLLVPDNYRGIGHMCFSDKEFQEQASMYYPLRHCVPDHYNLIESLEEYSSRMNLPAENEEDEDDPYANWLEEAKLKHLPFPTFNMKQRWTQQQTREANPLCLPLTDLLATQGFQIIVKMATIILTTENPKYKGGTWHIEGTSLEDIVASQICYVDSENISESRLDFRVSVFDPPYEQNVSRAVEGVYGFTDNSIMVNDVGSVITQTGRTICFPNLYQHQVQPFHLRDRNKAGHRRILAFFVVSPVKKIPSTSTLYTKDFNLFRHYWNSSPASVILPDCLHILVFGYVASFWTWQDALTHRSCLMEQRGIWRKESDQAHLARPFSLCEH